MIDRRAFIAGVAVVAAAPTSALVTFCEAAAVPVIEPYESPLFAQRVAAGLLHKCRDNLVFGYGRMTWPEASKLTWGHLFDFEPYEIYGFSRAAETSEHRIHLYDGRSFSPMALMRALETIELPDL